MTEDERFKILKDNRASIEVYKYLKERLMNLTIKVVKNEGSVLELMKKQALIGWCWQTIESTIVFLNNNDYIERGNLLFDELLNKIYYHSWINFQYRDMEYTFDPCLNILCPKKLYQEVFETEVRGMVSAKEVRDELINAILNPKPKKKYNFMKKLFGEDLENKKSEITIIGNDDVYSPMYRNSTGYKVEIEDGKIKKLVARFYIN